MSTEITRKDRLALNIAKSHGKCSKEAEIIPETYVLPE
jgi:hypothetical protein